MKKGRFYTYAEIIFGFFQIIKQNAKYIKILSYWFIIRNFSKHDK